MKRMNGYFPNYFTGPINCLKTVPSGHQTKNSPFYPSISALAILVIMSIATVATVAKLSSLSEWSAKHIKDVFESSTDESSLRAIRTTFADNLTATINGAPLPRAGIDQLVLAMRKSSKTGLKVDWRQAVEVARDPNTCRVSLSLRFQCPSPGV